MQLDQNTPTQLPATLDRTARAIRDAVHNKAPEAIDWKAILAEILQTIGPQLIAIIVALLTDQKTET
jgi:hypothetical protein